MTFMSPWVLLLLPLGLYVLKKRKLNAIEVSSLAGWKQPVEPRRVRWLNRLRGVRALICTLLILSVAGPRTERPVSEDIREGIAIEMLIDISNSMDQNIKDENDELTKRITAAKSTVEEFIKNRPDDLIGLISFARYADTLSPLTFGHSALIQLVQEVIIPDIKGEDGTAYGDALSLACAHLDKMDQWNNANEQPIQSKIIILLTDGENNCGLHLPKEAAGLAKKWGIHIYIISLGDSEEKEYTDSEEVLQVIGKETGGGFWKIFDLNELSEAYAQIDELETSEIKSTTRIHTEYSPIFHLFTLPALLLLLLERLLSATILRVTEETSS